MHKNDGVVEGISENIEVKKVLVLCSSYPDKDPRPSRFIDYFSKKGYPVSCLCKSNVTTLPVSDIHVLSDYANSRQGLKRRVKRLSFLLFKKLCRNTNLWQLLNRWHYIGWGDLNKVSKNFELIVVQDLELLPLAFKIKKKAKILFDAREYYPEQNISSFLVKYLLAPEKDRLCRYYLKKCDSVVSVSGGLVTRYNETYDIQSQILMSTPYRTNVSPSLTNTTHIKLVHHGAAHIDRGLLQMIDAIKSAAEHIYLDFYLVGCEKQIKKLKAHALDCNRIKFKKAVAFADINQMLKQYDLGLCTIYPSNFSLKYCLPNKFFEFIQARLGIIIGPSPDMASLIKKYNCGFIADDFSTESLVGLLNSLTVEKINQVKKNSDFAARQLCWEQEQKKIEQICGL